MGSKLLCGSGASGGHACGPVDGAGVADLGEQRVKLDAQEAPLGQQRAAPFHQRTDEPDDQRDQARQQQDDVRAEAQKPVDAAERELRAEVGKPREGDIDDCNNPVS